MTPLEVASIVGAGAAGAGVGGAYIFRALFGKKPRNGNGKDHHTPCSALLLLKQDHDTFKEGNADDHKEIKGKLDKVLFLMIDKGGK